MMEKKPMLKNILLSFIPIFVAVDALGVLPIYIGLTTDLSRNEKKRVIIQSLWTASIVAIAFLLAGRLLFQFLGISIPDFKIAGGAILFCIAITDILNPNQSKRLPSADLGSVPIGIPLIVGPAVLATLLVLAPKYGFVATIISILLNILIAAVVFNESHRLIKILGEAGTKALSKVMHLLLAAYAVMLIRNGIQDLLNIPH